MSSVNTVFELIQKPELLSEKLRVTADISNNRNLQIDNISSKISYLNFFSNYLVPNRPCVFGSWLTDNWKCRKEWVLSGGGVGGGGSGEGVGMTKLQEENFERINFPHLRELFGNAVVPVANCKSRQYDAQIKCDWKFAKYLAYLDGFDTMVCEEDLTRILRTTGARKGYH